MILEWNVVFMDLEYILKRLKELYDEGEKVRQTGFKKHYDHVVDLTPTTVNNGIFVKWQSKTIVFLEKILDSEDFRLINFKENVKTNYKYSVVEGLGILESLIEDIEDGNFNLENNNVQSNSDELIEKILNNFHRVVRQLRIRHDNRKTIEINDEYDVQDLLHALLLIHFSDVRSEEWTPSYAGGSSRMDFLINDENIVIETKMTRESLKDKKIGDELIIDMERYSVHPNCEKLYCFVYDPQEFIKNPIGLENDLSGIKDGLDVKVVIVPKF